MAINSDSLLFDRLTTYSRYNYSFLSFFRIKRIGYFTSNIDSQIYPFFKFSSKYFFNFVFYQEFIQYILKILNQALSLSFIFQSQGLYYSNPSRYFSLNIKYLLYSLETLLVASNYIFIFIKYINFILSIVASITLYSFSYPSTSNILHLSILRIAIASQSFWIF